MKDHKEIYDGITAMLQDPKIDADSLSAFFVKPTWSIIDDFYYLTHAQGGGLSNNQTDPYLKDATGKIVKSSDPRQTKYPPLPHVDGKYYHTSQDVTWETAKFLVKNITPKEFYEMNANTRMRIVQWFVGRGDKTSSPAINMLFTYCYWRGYHDEAETYFAWYKTKINDDIKTLGEFVVFCRVTDIMIYINSKLNGFRHNLGWIKGILCCYKLFKNYCVS